ncbi:hypothetical protein [Brevundimonas nasdae]|uniref:Uncharacterized protein n=2 Tax=Brevundimonas nasdae TaxID=172043 RepID=A0ABX8TI95_9CAUL|nr:hypothetical protein [Brevundimonas nasdae]QYC08849.1 hypothetical protein KWG56_09325 [Brevundimonas nasdae]QYC14898.1 hypothetical protein KWG63_04660 [Brevundimonas nasdae]
MKLRIAAVLLALAFSAASVAPVAAQANREDPRENATRGSGNARMGARNRDRAPQMTPEQIQAAAQEQATLANTGCQVTEAKLLGTTAERTSVYEMACAAGPGYIIETKTPPNVTDCVVLAHSAATLRASNPAADVGPQCTIAANLDTQRFLREYAQQAGVPCTVDDASVIGKSNEGAIVYEIGCSGEQGYWIKKIDNAWQKTECIQVLAERGTCRLTTAGEIAASVKKWLAGSDAAACDVTEARLMGQNANGMFYEAKCAAGDGFIARTNAERVVQQVYPCATAQQIGGGCTLTTAAAAAPAGGRP